MVSQFASRTAKFSGGRHRSHGFSGIGFYATPYISIKVIINIIINNFKWSDLPDYRKTD